MQTKKVGEPTNQRRVLRRHSEMEQALVDLVSADLEHPDWTGLLYVMLWDQEGNWVPLYIGKTERRGVKREVSSNIDQIETNYGKFARWGDNLDYHIGDLSHAVFQPKLRRKPTPKYKRWAKTLFESTDPPRLRHPVKLWIAP